MESRDYIIQYKQDDQWRMHRLHYHEGIELMLVLTDGGDFFMDRKMYPLKKNTLFILNANTLHRDENGADGSVFKRYVLHILPSLLEQLSTPQTDFAEALKNSGACVLLNEEDSKRLARLFEKLRISMPPSFGTDILERITLYEILLLVCSRIRSTKKEHGTSNQDYNRVQPILDYLRKNCTEHLSLDELADHFMLSKHYLCHIFKKGTGFSVMEYVIQLRIITAQQLLRQGANVQEASEKSGFQTYSHFIRTFNSYVGVSPKKYAKLYRQGDRYAVNAEIHGVRKMRATMPKKTKKDRPAPAVRSFYYYFTDLFLNRFADSQCEVWATICNACLHDSAGHFIFRFTRPRTPGGRANFTPMPSVFLAIRKPRFRTSAKISVSQRFRSVPPDECAFTQTINPYRIS